MANFDIRRFGRVLWWMAVSMRKEVLANTGAMFFAYMVVFVTNMLLSRNANFMDSANMLLFAIIMNSIIFLIVCIIGGSWIIKNMKTKEQYVMFMTLPASDIEKFAARALYVTVGLVLMSFLAYCLADVFRIVMSVMTGVNVVTCTIPRLLSCVFCIYGVMSGVPPESLLGKVMMCVASCAWLFCVNSIYVLGGVFFRRRKFVLTSCCFFGLGVVFSMVKFILFGGNVPIVTNDNFVACAIANCVVFILWGVINWWLAYRLFRRMQVINNKWINL